MPADQNLDPHYALPQGKEATVTDPGHLLPEHASEGSGNPKGSKLRLVIVLLLVLLAIGLIVWRIRSNNAAQEKEGQKAAAAANRPTPVQVTAVQQKTEPVYLTGLGTVTPYNTVTLHSRVDGQLLQVNFREGQTVRKGNLLLQIDPRPYQAAVDQAVGTAAKDEANLKNAQAEAQRYSALYEAGVVSKESQQSQVSTAGQAAGTLKADQAAIEAAKVNLSYTRIYAPIDGVVGLRQVDPGNIVHASDSTGLVVITQVHPIAIIFTLPEDQLQQVQQAMRGGSKLVVEAFDRNDAHKIASGTLLTIDNQIDTTTGTAKLKAIFDNADSGLFPNQFVNVRLILRQRQNATVIPTAAIQSGTQGTFVFVVNPGPTPEAKRPKQPQTANGAGKAKGKKGNSGTDEAGATPANGESEQGGGKAGQQQPKYHADMQSVHVDFTIGTDSVISDGELHAGQQVITDGAEKLIDGGNVAPTLSRGKSSAATSDPASVNSGVGAGAASPGTTAQQSGSNGAQNGGAQGNGGHQ